MVSLFLVAGLGAGFLTPINPHHTTLKEGAGEAYRYGATDVQEHTMYRPRGSGGNESRPTSGDWIKCAEQLWGDFPLGECIEACRRDQRCKYWTFNRHSSVCWHAGNNADGNRVAKENLISGRP